MIIILCTDVLVKTRKYKSVQNTYCTFQCFLYLRCIGNLFDYLCYNALTSDCIFQPLRLLHDCNTVQEPEPSPQSSVIYQFLSHPPLIVFSKLILLTAFLTSPSCVLDISNLNFWKSSWLLTGVLGVTTKFAWMYN